MQKYRVFNKKLANQMIVAMQENQSIDIFPI